MDKWITGCEESGKVRDELRKRGHDAVSCDIVPSRVDNRYHIQGDIVRHLLSVPDKYYDGIILFPDCTCMAVCGNKTYAEGKEKYKERLEAIAWTVNLWNLALMKGKKVALENPGSVIFPVLREKGVDIQYIQPWMFGHGETKKTGLALYNLPPLMATDIVPGREQRIWKMPPSETRKRDRSETYDGISKAMADQWR